MDHGVHIVVAANWGASKILVTELEKYLRKSVR